MLRRLIIHFPTGPGASERASKQMSTAERASQARRLEPANEWAVPANEQTDERLAQYLRPYSSLFQTTVDRGGIYNHDDFVIA